MNLKPSDIRNFVINRENYFVEVGKELRTKIIEEVKEEKPKTRCIIRN